MPTPMGARLLHERIDLDKRKLMAEFDEPGERWYFKDGGRAVYSGRCGKQALHFESDTAAACSLLPKIAKAWKEKQMPGLRLRYLFEDVMATTWNSNDAEACRLIYEAVQEIKSAESAKSAVEDSEKNGEK